jgi:hypothetical protein
LISKGYSTIASCHGHEKDNQPYILLNKNLTNPEIEKHINNLFVEFVSRDDCYVIKGRSFLIFSNSFLCKQIEKVVNRLPINMMEN